jgi:hypothetical protein
MPGGSHRGQNHLFLPWEEVHPALNHLFLPSENSSRLKTNWFCPGRKHNRPKQHCARAPEDSGGAGANGSYLLPGRAVARLCRVTHYAPATLLRASAGAGVAARPDSGHSPSGIELTRHSRASAGGKWELPMNH